MFQPWVQFAVAAALVLYSGSTPAETNAPSTQLDSAPATQPERGLEFRIAAESDQLAELEDYLEQLDQHGPNSGQEREFRWIALRRLDNVALTTDMRQHLEEHLTRLANPDMDAEARGVANDAVTAAIARQHLIARPHAGRLYVLLGNAGATAMTREGNWSVRDVRDFKDASGRSAVLLRFDDRGAQRLGEVTGQHVGRTMAIVLDGQIVVAPTLQGRLREAAVISGDFAPEQVRSMIASIRESAGRAPPEGR